MNEQTNIPLGEPTRFYLYDQNNSGGFFVRNKNFGENVLIEARSPGEANEKMQDMGCWEHSVCSCCGDRWRMFNDNKDYGVYETAEEVIARCAPDPAAEHSWRRKGEDLVIHFLTGRIEWHNKDQREA